jgi:UPF0755 protein
MSVTRDLPLTANDNQGRIPAGGGGRDRSVLPRSPSEALVPQRPPVPPEREEYDPDPHPFLRMFDGLVTFVFLIACAALAVYYWIKVKFDQPGPLQTSAVVVIPRGEGVSAIAERLQRDGIIADRRLFMTSIIYFKYLKGYGTLKAGEYEFPKRATMRQVLDTIVEGKSIEHKVTLAEGLTSYQIVQKLLAHPELKGEITEIPPEGSLLPDTYKFGSNDTRQGLIERMQAAQKKFMEKVWPTRAEDVVVRTPEEALILASIVEKETGIADERPLIAAVFQNRLRKNMRLQSDPTIIYGLVGGKGALDGPITRDDLDKQTAYNTYQINGLPPTPIANPGRAAIEAVLRPAKTNALYFVADGTGGHVFARTLEEHNRNVVKWRKIEREMRAQEAAAKAAQEAAAAAGADAAGGAVETDAADSQAVPEIAGPPEPGAAVAKTVPGDPTITAGTLANPDMLMIPAAPFAVPAEAAPGEAVPAPQRNPRR